MQRYLRFVADRGGEVAKSSGCRTHHPRPAQFPGFFSLHFEALSQTSEKLPVFFKEPSEFCTNRLISQKVTQNSKNRLVFENSANCLLCRKLAFIKESKPIHELLG